MNKYLKVAIILSLQVAIFFCATCISFGATDYFKMTSCGNTYYSVAWQYTPTIGYEKEAFKSIKQWVIKEKKSGKVLAKSSNVRSNTMTVTGLSTGYTGYVELWYRYVYDKEVFSIFVDSCFVNTNPSPIATKNFGLDGCIENKVSFIAKAPKGASGVQFKIYNGNTGKCVKTKSVTNINRNNVCTVKNISLKRNYLYKYRIRTYYVNSSNGKKYYSTWSGLRYFDNAKYLVEKRAKKNGARVTIKGVKGISGYKVYVATTGGSKGVYTRTIYPKQGKKKVYYISKMGNSTMAKRHLYYVNLVPIIAATGTESDIYSYGYFFN